MNQKIREKLKMSGPEFYDATENRVAVAQEHALCGLFRDARAEGKSIAACLGAAGVLISTLLTLASVQSFGDTFGIPGSAWRAIFIMVAAIATFVTISELVKIGIRLWKKNFWSEDIVRAKFFSPERQLNEHKSAIQRERGIKSPLKAIRSESLKTSSKVEKLIRSGTHTDGAKTGL
jgi:hypothetical protein